MTIADFGDGDQVLVAGVRYRLMIPMRGGHLARRWLGDAWSLEYTWMGFDVEAEEIHRMPGRRKMSKKQQAQQDPLQWRGTQKGEL